MDLLRYLQTRKEVNQPQKIEVFLLRRLSVEKLLMMAEINQFFSSDFLLLVQKGCRAHL